MLLFSATNLNAELPIFPGADGFGAVTGGGQWWEGPQGDQFKQLQSGKSAGGL